MSATRLSFSYPQEMKDELSKLAKKDDRHLSGYVQKVLNDHIKKYGNPVKTEKPPAPKKKRKRKRE